MRLDANSHKLLLEDRGMKMPYATWARLVLAALALVLVTWAGLTGCGEKTKIEHHCYYDNPQPDATAPDGDADVGPHEYRQVTILQTTDLHDHASGYSRFADYTPLDTTDNDLVRGGYSRIAALINQIRAEQDANGTPVLLLDSGDFTMGTVYTMSIDDPITFKFLQLMGYDAVTIGNHEFDFTPEGLEMMVNNALASPEGFDIPLLATNMVTDASDTADDGLEQLVADGVIVRKLVLDLPNGLRVGILGVIGDDADTAAPLAPPVTFNHETSYIQKQVDDLREIDGVHMVIINSHSGIHEVGTGDDTELALAINGINVIASGHYHEVTPEGFTVNGAVIFSSGCYGKNLGRLDVNFDITAGEVADATVQIIPADDTVTGDASIQAFVETYDATLNALLMGAIGMDLNTPVVEVPYDMETRRYRESGLCNMCADAMRYTASFIAWNNGDATPGYHVSAFPSGSARDGLYRTQAGYAAFADVFNVIPLGISPDPANQNSLGWPMISFWLTPKEIKEIAEVSVSLSVSFGLEDAFICFSGIRVEYDPYGPTMPPDRVLRVWLCGNALPAFAGGDEDTFSENCSTELDLTDETTLYRVVTDLYNIFFIRQLEDAGLHIEPKYADGSPIIINDTMDIMDARIDLDPFTPGIQELKPWMLFTQFLLMVFPDNNGIPGIPEITGVYDATGAAMGRFIEVP